MDRIRLLGCALLALISISLSASASSGLTWTWRSPSKPDLLTAIAYGGGIYVTVGQDGLIYMSHDGSNWSAESSVIGAGGTYLEAIYANGLFLLTGTDATGTVHVTSSPDGVTWTDAVPGVSSLEGTELAFGNSIYVLMGDGADATSPDGITWTTHTLAFNGVDSPLLFAHGVFMVAHDTDIFYGTDGVTWNAATTTPGTSSGVFTTTGSAFFFFQSDGSAVYTSTDGNAWAKHVPTGSPPTGESYVFWDGSHFRTAVFDQDHADQLAFSSNNGLAWTESGVSMSSPMLGPVLAFDGTHYMATTGNGFLQILRSTNFDDWTTAAVASNGSQVDFSEITGGGGVLVAAGGTSSAPSKPAIVESADGITWNRVYTGTADGAITSVAYGNGVFVATGAASLSSADGVTWSPIAGLPPAGSVVFGNGRFVAFTSCCSLTSTDGRTWTSHDLPADFISDNAFTVAYDGTRFVSIGTEGVITSVYTSCDGITWTHSANIYGDEDGSDFVRLRLVGSQLFALGNETCGQDNCEFIGTFGVVAYSKDATHWTTNIDNGSVGYPYLSDIASDGTAYYYVAGGEWPGQSNALIFGDSPAVGFPADANPTTLFNDGHNLYVVGTGGEILSAPVTGGGPTATGGTCSALPAIPDQVTPPPPPPKSSNGGGDFGFFSLAGLLGLLLVRRRAGIQSPIDRVRI